MIRGDAKIIKNAGNAAVDRDVIRSVAAAIYALGAEEVMVVGHYDCGMANVDPEKLENTMKERGVDEKLLSEVNLKDWIGAIDGEEENVVEVVEKIKESPFIPEDVPIHGLIIDLYDGKLKVLVEGKSLIYLNFYFLISFLKKYLLNKNYLNNRYKTLLSIYTNYFLFN